MKKQSCLWRGFFYCVGRVMLTCGTMLNTKTLLGVSPILSIPYCIFVLYGRRFGLLNVLQFPVSVLSSWLVSLSNTKSSFSGAGVPRRLGLLAAAIVLTGFGICLMGNMELVSHPEVD